MRATCRVAAFLGALAAGGTAWGQAAPEPAPGETAGQLRVGANRPETTVQVDGASAGVAPVSIPLAPGTHRLRLTSPGFHAWEGTAVVDAEATTRVRAWLRPLPSRGDAWTVVGFGVATLAASIALGAFSWADHASLQSDLQAGVLADDDARISRGQSLAVGADVGWGVTGVLAVVALVLFVRDGSAPSTASVSPPRVHGARP